MLKQFRDWVYLFVTERLLKDEFFISRLDSALKQHNKQLEVLKEAARRLKIDALQRKMAEERIAEIKKLQDSCSHLKGGRLRSPCGEDYNIWIHIFTDNSRTVRCLTCRKEWTGDQLKSPEVQHMLAHTTNTLTSSEFKIGPAKDQEFPGGNAPMTEEEEIANNPLWPFASRIYVQWWDKMLKKLRKKKRLTNNRRA
jgi:hypothetical protein